jgi:hypothetical protein
MFASAPSPPGQAEAQAMMSNTSTVWFTNSLEVSTSIMDSGAIFARNSFCFAPRDLASVLYHFAFYRKQFRLFQQ